MSPIAMAMTVRISNPEESPRGFPFEVLIRRIFSKIFLVLTTLLQSHEFLLQGEDIIGIGTKYLDV